MEDIVNLITAFIFSGILFFGTGHTLKQIHDFVKKETLLQISKGLKSSEQIANALTGEKLDY